MKTFLFSIKFDSITILIIILSIANVSALNSVVVHCNRTQISNLGKWVNYSIPGNMGYSRCVFNFTASLQAALDEDRENLKDLRISYQLIVSNLVNKTTPLLFTIKRQHENVKFLKLPFTYSEEPMTDQEPFNLPMSFKSSTEWYYTLGGNLCFDTHIRNGSSRNAELLVKVSAENGCEELEFGILIEASRGLFLTLGDKKMNSSGTSVTPILSPTVSTYIGFDFKHPLNKNVKNVTVIAKSLVTHPPCTMMSIQNPLCPIQDNELTILFEGKSQAILDRGVIFIYQQEFDDKNIYGGGFVVVLVVLTDDSKCKSSGSHFSEYDKSRTNVFQVTIEASPWDTSIAGAEKHPNILFTLFFPLAILLIIFISIIFLWLAFLQQSRRAETVPRINVFDTKPRYVGDFVYVEDLVLSDFELDPIALDHDTHRQFQTDTFIQTLNYSLALMVIILFRIITLSETTDLSLCFYNRLCTYQINLGPLKFFMWNSVLSSAAFTIGAIVYLWYLQFVRRYIWPGASRTVQLPGEKVYFGIPEGFGFQFALGGVFLLEGLVSAMSHVCTNFGSFLFDAPVMDLFFILSWIRIHRLRYPIYMTIHWTTAIAVTNMVFEMILTVSHYKHNTSSVLYIILGLKVFYFNTLVVLHCFYIYYIGHFREPRPTIGPYNEGIVTYLPRMIKFWWAGLGCCPDRPFELLISVLVATINCGATISLFVMYVYKNEIVNPEILQEITECNIMFALLMHFIRKFYYEGLCFENRKFKKLNILPFTCFILYITTHYVYYFLYHLEVFDWSLTQAESMELNEPCIDGFYDTHDHYHFYKAASYFFLFFVLTTINDSSANIRRQFIKVF